MESASPSLVLLALAAISVHTVGCFTGSEGSSGAGGETGGGGASSVGSAAGGASGTGTGPDTSTGTGDGVARVVDTTGYLHLFETGESLQGSEPLADEPVLDVIGGAFRGCAIYGDRGLGCVGANSYGEIVPDGPGEVTELTRIEGIAGARDAAIGLSHICAIIEGGTVLCWGDPGIPGLEPGIVERPTEVPGIGPARSIAAGAHTCAVIEDGSVACWGGGWMGNGEYTHGDVDEAITVPGVEGATHVAISGFSTCVLLGTGSIKCWGKGIDESLGELGDTTTHGDGSVEDAPSPVDVVGIDDAVSVSIGGDHACALVADGRVFCWGEGEGGVLGNGSDDDQPTPVAIAGDRRWSQVVANPNTTTLVDEAGDLYMSGYMPDTTTTRTPTLVPLFGGPEAKDPCPGSPYEGRFDDVQVDSWCRAAWVYECAGNAEAQQSLCDILAEAAPSAVCPHC